jgi:hypothetical protein
VAAGEVASKDPLAGEVASSSALSHEPQIPAPQEDVTVENDRPIADKSEETTTEAAAQPTSQGASRESPESTVGTQGSGDQPTSQGASRDSPEPTGGPKRTGDQPTSQGASRDSLGSTGGPKGGGDESAPEGRSVSGDVTALAAGNLAPQQAGQHADVDKGKATFQGSLLTDQGYLAAVQALGHLVREGLHVHLHGP